MKISYDAIRRQIGNRRPELLKDALEITLSCCAPPENMVEGRKSEQYWMQRFSRNQAKIEEAEASTFFEDFRLKIAGPLAYDKVAEVIGAHILREEFSPISGVRDLSAELCKCVTHSSSKKKKKPRLQRIEKREL